MVAHTEDAICRHVTNLHNTFHCASIALFPFTRCAPVLSVNVTRWGETFPFSTLFSRAFVNGRRLAKGWRSRCVYFKYSCIWISMCVCSRVRKYLHVRKDTYTTSQTLIPKIYIHIKIFIYIYVTMGRYFTDFFYIYQINHIFHVIQLCPNKYP